MRLVDVYKQGRKNILETQKPLKKVLTSPHTPGLKDPSIDFNSARVIDKGNFRVRKTLESWHTANYEPC